MDVRRVLIITGDQREFETVRESFQTDRSLKTGIVHFSNSSHALAYLSEPRNAVDIVVLSGRISESACEILVSMLDRIYASARFPVVITSSNHHQGHTSLPPVQSRLPDGRLLLPRTQQIS